MVVLHVIDERGIDRLLRAIGEEKLEDLKKYRAEETQKNLKRIAEELESRCLS